jgi:plastocyanin
VKDRIPLKLLLAALAIVPCAATQARAQGPVSGRVSIRERPGEVTSDVANTVIYLLPTGERKLRFGEMKVPMAMSARQFTPRVRVVTPGSSVEYPNQDPFSHNIFSTAAGAAFDLGTYPEGVARSARFRKAGAFPIYCNIHAKMTAYVVVVPTPHYVIAGADGRWTLPGVPAGRYDLHVWHERAPEVVSGVEVPATGLPDLVTSLDARGYQSKPHMNKFGKEYTSTGKDRY